MRKVFSFDGETNGLWGRAFAIGALVLDESGAEIARFVGRLLDAEVTDQWVRDNVLPQIAAIPVSHESYADLIRDFADFYMAHKEGADIVAHMGYIVEAKILRDMHDMGYIGDFEGPYPLHDVAGLLQANGVDPTSVDKFAADHSLPVGAVGGGQHHPLYDSTVAAMVYRNLMGWSIPYPSSEYSITPVHKGDCGYYAVMHPQGLEIKQCCTHKEAEDFIRKLDQDKPA